MMRDKVRAAAEFPLMALINKGSCYKLNLAPNWASLLLHGLSQFSLQAIWLLRHNRILLIAATKVLFIKISN